MIRLHDLAARLLEGVLLLGTLVVLVGLLALRPSLPTAAASTTRTIPAAAVTGGAPLGSPDALKAAAADLLRQTVAKDGAGYRFEIVQRSTIVARPGGPQVPIPDPADPRGKPIGFTDALYQLGLVETGFVTPDGFSMEMRSGPMTADAPVELTRGDLIFGALVKEGRTYRNDGEGWYETDRPPGIGLDPRTASLVPQFLERATNASDTDRAALASELGSADPDARALTADGRVADLPGVLAVDGESFTELIAPVGLTFDGAGRLSGLIVRARNTNLETYDLVVVTEIAIRYDDVPIGLPDPAPALPLASAEAN